MLAVLISFLDAANVTTYHPDLPYHHAKVSSENGSAHGLLLAIVTTLVTILLSKSKNKTKVKVRKDLSLRDSEPKSPFKYAHNLFSVRLPIVDGLYNLMVFGRDGVQALDDMTTKFGYQYKVALGTMTIYVVNDPNIAQKVLTSTEPTHMNKPAPLYDWIFVEFFKDGLINSKYETWFPHRKMLSRCFTYKSLQHYVKIMDKHAKGLVRFLQGASPDSEEAAESDKIHDALYFHAMKIIHEILMGVDRFSDNTLAEFSRIFNSHKHDVLDRLMNPILQFPPYWYFHPNKKRYDHENTYLTTFLLQITQEYRKERAEMKAKGEYDQYFQSDEDSDIGVKPFRCVIEEMLYCDASDKEIYDEIGSLIGAGHETTVVATEMLLLHLALNQECQHLCREEIDCLLQEKLDDELTMEDLTNLKYLERCIMESGRLTATVPAFIRTLETSLKVNDEFEFPAGSTVAFLPWVMHRNLEYFPEPFKFDPDRFLPENIKTRHPYAYLPFSSGHRNCIGWKVSMMEMKVLMVWILHSFEVYSKDKLEDVKLKFEVTLNPERNYSLLLKKRFVA